MRIGGWCALGLGFVVGCGSSDDSSSATGGKSSVGGASSGGGSAQGGSNGLGGSTSSGGASAMGGDANANGGDGNANGGDGNANGGDGNANGGAAPAGGTAGSSSGGGGAGGVAANGGAGGVNSGGKANGGSANGGSANGGTMSGGASSGGTMSGGASSGGASSGGTTSKGGAAGSGGSGGGNECPEGSTGAGCSTCVVYVKQTGGNDSNDGTTWATAKANLQAGVDTAAAGTSACQVWVAQGLYVPTYKADPFAAANTATLLMRAGVALYGGFAGGERSLTARNFETNVTTITGEIGGAAQTDNLSRVVTWADGARLDGFTVTRSYGPAIECTSGKLEIHNCKITGNLGGYTGGGLHLAGTCDGRVVASSFTSNTVTYNSDSRGGGINAESGTNLTVENCTFSANASTSGSGGGIMSFGGARVTGSTFENNTASNTGGGAYLAGPGAVVEDCVFRNNQANSGSAMYSNSPTVRRSAFTTNKSLSIGAVYTNSITVEDSTFTGNTAINVNGATSARGGAIQASGVIKIKRSSFSENSVSAGNASTGGAIHCPSTCSATLVGVKFHNNSAFGLGTTSSYGHGGAISFAGTSLSLVDCEFTANRTRVHGGAIYNTASASSGTLSAVNSTFYGNTTAAGSGGAIYNASSPSTFLNSIFWGNTASVQGNQVYNNGTATSAVRSCDVQGIGSSASNGNIDQDPLFVSTSAGSLDLKLQSGSPCINKGANAELPADVLDLDDDSNVSEAVPLDIDGVARIQGATVDMGAHETL